MTVTLKQYTGNKFYNGAALEKIGAPWNCILSERGAGKSLYYLKECVTDCSGLTICDNPILNFACSDEEAKEIIAALKEGVII